MLGLGLALSVAKGVIDEIGGLLSKLARRVTFSENLFDTRNIITDIDNADVLDKASILLTPTATSDARVHSVKTYTGDDYVVGGDFSDFSTDWSTNTATESGGVVTIPDSGYIFQNISFPNDGTIQIRVEGSGTVKYRLGTTSPSNTFITKTLPFTAYEDLNSTDVRMQLNNTSGSDITVTSVSVIDVSSDFDFDRASSATRINSSGLVQDMQSITDPELVLNGDFEELGDELVTNGTFDTDSDWNFLDDSWKIIDGKLILTDTSTTNVNQAIGLVQNKFYKIVFTIANTTLGGVRVRLGTGAITSEFTNGTHTIYLEQTTTNDAFRFYASTSGVFNGSIDNVSVQQVNVDSEGNDIWILNASGDSSALITDKLTLTCDDGDFVNAAQSYSFVDGNNYRVSFDLTGDNQSKSFTFRDNSSGLGGLTEDISLDFEGTETKTFIFTANANSDSIYTKRNSSGTYSWSIDNISLKDITFSTDVDLARINYDSNGENGHILLEPTSTNLVPYSEDFSAWTNTVSETTDTPNAATSPSGESNATKLQEANSSNSFHRLSKTISLSSATNYSLSIFAKKGTLSNMQLMLLNTSDSKMFSKVFNLENGRLGETLTNGGQSLTDSKIEDIGNGWYRCSIVGQLSTAPNTFRINLADASTGNTTSNGMVQYTGDGNGNIFIYGAQLEALSYASSYIPTLTGGTVTRATETLTGSGNSTLINSTEGVLYAEIAMLSENDKASNNQLFLNDGTSLQRVGIFTESAGDIRVQIRDNDEAIDIRNLTALDQSESGVDTAAFNKIAILYKSGQNKLFVNGSRITDTNFDSMVFNFSSLDNLDFGSGANSNYFRGKCKALAVFNEALSDTELGNLTNNS